jgi:hypothetical protein
MQLTDKARRLVEEWGAQYAGKILLNSVTRYTAELEVDGEFWAFSYDEGRAVLNSRPKNQATKDLTRLAHFRALEAMEAVRAGHGKATEKKRAKNQPDAEPLRARQLKLPS